MPETTLIEQRRRISEQDRRQLAFVLTLAWFGVTAAMISVILLTDYRRFENRFLRSAITIEDHIQARLRENEAVLEGLAAFLSGKTELDNAQISNYARKLQQRFPHIFMLEVAESVSVEHLADFVKRQQNKGYAEFKIKAFDYFGARQWRPLTDKRQYYPLVFLSPLPVKSRPVLGLDLGSHAFLYEPLQRALKTGVYQTSMPFHLIEGDHAFVMFKPVEALDDTNEKGKSRFIVLIVLLSHRMLNAVMHHIDDAMEVLIYHNEKPKEDTIGHLYHKASVIGIPLLPATYEADLEPGRAGLVLSLEKRFSLLDPSWRLIALTTLTSMMIFFYFRSFSLKRYNRAIEWAKDESRLQQLACYDALTALHNRHSLLDHIESLVREPDSKLRLAMLFLDLDQFKQVNDQHGHKIGDALLQKVAQRIRGSIRKSDVAGRLGGDEFVVLLLNYAATENVHQAVDKLRAKIEAPYTIEGCSIRVGVSIGTAFYPEDSPDLTDLLHLADKAMFSNKSERSGKDYYIE